MGLEKKKDSKVNQQAEGKTHLDRLSSETDWRHEALLGFLEAPSPKSPIWSTVPPMYMPSRPRLLLGNVSLLSVQTAQAALALSFTRHQVWEEKTPVCVYLNLDLCLSVKRKEE